MSISSLTSQDDPIIIQGARMHNLKNITVAIPRNKMTVITGVSGSGKSSLALHTLFAEGQRRYAESLSAYARQFLMTMTKPEVDDIKGLAPTIAINQKVMMANPRSTVGTMTEIYEYLKLLFVAIGKTYSPISGKEVKRQNINDVLNYILNLPQSTTAIITFEMTWDIKDYNNVLKDLLKKSFSRLIVNGNISRIEDLLEEKQSFNHAFIIVDRITTDHNNQEINNRITDALEIAFYEGKGSIQLHIPNGIQVFSNAFSRDNMTFTEPHIHLFSFNSPLGACPTCEGYGQAIVIDPLLVIPNPHLSIYDDAIAPWRTQSMSSHKTHLIRISKEAKIPIFKPINAFTPHETKALWHGNNVFQGLCAFFKSLEKESYKIQYRVLLSRYKTKSICPSCQSGRLRQEALYR